jgi:hypothetical protein
MVTEPWPFARYQSGAQDKRVAGCATDADSLAGDRVLWSWNDFGVTRHSTKCEVSIGCCPFDRELKLMLSKQQLSQETEWTITIMLD